MKKLILSAALFAGIAFAGNPNTGCGLGSMVIQNQDTLLKQVVASTLNGISSNQTFGISTGTLGCAKPQQFANNEKLQRYVIKNMDSIAMDAARGNGESIKTLAKLMNVQNEAAFAAKIKQNFGKIFASENVTAAQVIDNISTYAL